LRLLWPKKIRVGTPSGFRFNYGYRANTSASGVEEHHSHKTPYQRHLDFPQLS